MNLPRNFFGRKLMAILSVMALFALAASCAGEPAAERPNVLIILADDLGYNDVGFNGATEVNTPNIDRLAEAGVVFTNGYVSDPLCAASRAGIMTGRYQSRFGYELNPDRSDYFHSAGLPLPERTIADYLKAAGYRTGMAGKWHLGGGQPYHPLNRGFDTYYGVLPDNLIRHDYWGLMDDQSADTGAAHLPLSDWETNRFSGYLTDVLTDHALAFLNEPGDDPFFLYLSYNAVHNPLQAPDDIIEKYRHIEDPGRRTYLAMVDSLDQNIGRVIAQLKTSGRWDNTLTFFLGDNGGHEHPRGRADNSPLRLGKKALFEGGIRVPFVAVWPGRWPAGETYDPMVISLDIAATPLTAAGERPPRLDGVDLDPFIRGQGDGPPHTVLAWRVFTNGDELLFAVRSGDLKLTNVAGAAGLDRGEIQLYNLKNDIGETRNLIGENPELVAKYADLWNDWNRRNLYFEAFPVETQHLRLKGQDNNPICIAIPEIVQYEYRCEAE